MPLHLLVKEEIADEVTTHLGALRGKVVNLGSSEASSSYLAAREVLAFAGLRLGAAGQPGDFHATNLSPVQLAAETDRARLPDAIFLAAVLPNPTVRQLVAGAIAWSPCSSATPSRSRRWPSLCLNSCTSGPVARHRSTEADRRPIILREHIVDTVIPAFTYQADPGVSPHAAAHARHEGPPDRQPPRGARGGRPGPQRPVSDPLRQDRPAARWMSTAWRRSPRFPGIPGPSSTSSGASRSSPASSSPSSSICAASPARSSAGCFSSGSSSAGARASAASRASRPTSPRSARSNRRRSIGSGPTMARSTLPSSRALVRAGPAQGRGRRQVRPRRDHGRGDVDQLPHPRQRRAGPPGPPQ